MVELRFKPWSGSLEGSCSSLLVLFTFGHQMYHLSDIVAKAPTYGHLLWARHSVTVTSAISLNLPCKYLPRRVLRAAFLDRNLSLCGEDVPVWGKWLNNVGFLK